MTLLSSLQDAVRQGVCTILGTTANAVDFTSPLWGTLIDGSPFIELPDGGRQFQLPVYNGPRALQGLICNQEPNPIPAPPFQGGQCECVSYAVSFNPDNAGQPFNPTTNLRGPIGPITFRRLEGSSNPDNYRIFIRYGVCQRVDGQDVLVGFTEYTAGTFNNPDPNPTITGIVRNDGRPDVCGDPLPVLPPPTPDYGTIINNNFTFVDNSGNNITIPLALAFFKPVFDIDGKVKIPVKIDLGGITFDGDIEPDGTVDIGPPSGRRPKLPGGSPGDAEGGRGAPSPPSEVPDPVETIPSNPEDIRKMIGAVVTTTLLSGQRATPIAQEENPIIYAPNLGFINFFYQVDTKRGAWGADIPIKNRNQFVPVEYDKGAIDVKGTPQAGVTWEITPIYDTTFELTPAEPLPTPTEA